MSRLRLVSKRLVPMLALLIAACATQNQGWGGAAHPDRSGGSGRSTQASDAAATLQQLRDDASQIAHQIKQNGMSKTAGADALNARRLSLIGGNPVDDDVFNAYREIAVLRDAGKLGSVNAQSRMLTKLGEVRKRYRQVPQAQAPIFTNFMMELYHLPSL